MRSLAGVITACLALASVFAMASVAGAQAYYVNFDFDTSWGGDYAPGWENTLYRHGAPPVGKMMEYVAGGKNGTGGMRLIADSAPQSWMWWAIVNPIDVNMEAMKKQHNPWLSVWYYDQGYESGSLHRSGQLYAVPSWVNMYIDEDPVDGTPDADWTDVQFGARFNQASPNDKYYYVATGENSPGWQNTGVARKSSEWTHLKMQLLNSDGKIHFYVDGTEVGSSYRSDYEDLVGLALSTMYSPPLSNWGDDKPSTIWDDYEFGSDYVIPEPMSMILGSLGLATLAGLRRFRRR